MKLFLILIWYVICALIVKAFFTFYDLVNYQRFRDSSGDHTNQVGYEEDSVGQHLNGFR